MSNFIIFLKHADTEIDPSTPVEDWILSEKGHDRIKKTIELAFFNEIDVIYSSSENKALETTSYIERKFEKKASVIDDLKELQRKGGFLKSKGEYDKKVKKILNNEPVENWENTLSASTRMKVALDKIVNENKNRVIVIVSHGIVISLYAAYHFKWKPKEAYSKWKKLNFCDWIIIEQ